MSTEQPPVPLPPPPLQADTEPAPDWRLSWWTVLYMAIVGRVVELLLPQAVIAAGAPLPSLGVVLSGVGQGAVESALFALGVIMSDRRASTRSPRAARWALGAAIGAAVIPILALVSIAPALIRFGPAAVPVASVARQLLSAGLRVAGSALVGFWLGRALRPETDPWRRLPLAGLEASLIVGGALTVLSLVIVLLGISGSRGTPMQLAGSFGIQLALGAIGGLLTGCAFAAGLRRANDGNGTG